MTLTLLAKRRKYLVLFQASNIVLFLQPDRPLRAHLLHGSSWIHTSTGLGGKAHIRYFWDNTVFERDEHLSRAECKSELGIHVQVCCHPETCCFQAFLSAFKNSKN